MIGLSGRSVMSELLLLLNCVVCLDYAMALGCCVRLFLAI